MLPNTDLLLVLTTAEVTELPVIPGAAVLVLLVTAVSVLVLLITVVAVAVLVLLEVPAAATLIHFAESVTKSDSAFRFRCAASQEGH
jgi:hypothetical protein